MRVLIGIPTGLYNPLAETMQHLLNYWLLNPPVPVTIWLEISNRVDVNRSKLILKQAKEGYDVQIMMDSDILVDTPFREVMRIYKQSMEHGCDVLVAGVPQIGWKDVMLSRIRKIADGYYAIYGGSTALTIIPLYVAKKLIAEPLGHFGETPLVTINAIDATEDYILFTNMREKGFHVCGTEKIELRHRKITNVKPES